MPIKYNLMNYDITANSIHKVQAKNENELNDNDKSIKTLGILIASFASSFSWHTYKCITDGLSISNTQEVKEEFENAKRNAWKQIRNVDVQEVLRTFGAMSKAARDKFFFEWLFFINAEKEMHDSLKRAWSELEKDMTVECDSIS
ncbi:MAG: hypothetical protein ACP5TL_02360 [Candidatus Micrarchaeia archaeon]